MVRNSYFNDHGFNKNRYKNPCKDCEKRHVGCHGTCDDYKSWSLKEQTYKLEMRKKESPRYFAGRKKI